MALKIKVEYVDGREVIAVVSPRAQVMAEEKFGGIAESVGVRASFYMAWASLHKAGKEPADYETWLDAIADVEVVEEKPTDPTPATQSTTGSSD